MKRVISNRTSVIIVVFAVVFAAALGVTGCGARTAASPAPLATPAPMPAVEVHSVDALLKALPVAETPPMNEMEAMALAAFPLS